MKKERKLNKTEKLCKPNVGAGLVSARRGITLIALAISRKCVRYEERA